MQNQSAGSASRESLWPSTSEALWQVLRDCGNRSGRFRDGSMVGPPPKHEEPLWPPLGRLYDAASNSEHAQDYSASIAMVAASGWAGPRSSCPRWAAFMECFTSRLA